MTRRADYTKMEVLYVCRFVEMVSLIRSPRKISLENTVACIDLMKEFLRREAIWSKELKLDGELPFANLPAAAVGTQSCEAEYSDLLSAFTYSTAEYKCCLAMLDWYCGVKNELPVLSEGKQLDPYLPLFHFFQLGGTFRSEHRVFIDINSRETIHSVTIQKGDLTMPFVVLSE